jgi:hypothetical protein
MIAIIIWTVVDRHRVCARSPQNQPENTEIARNTGASVHGLVQACRTVLVLVPGYVEPGRSGHLVQQAVDFLQTALGIVASAAD